MVALHMAWLRAGNLLYFFDTPAAQAGGLCGCALCRMRPAAVVCRLAREGDSQ